MERLCKGTSEDFYTSKLRTEPGGPSGDVRIAHQILSTRALWSNGRSMGLFGQTDADLTEFGNGVFVGRVVKGDLMEPSFLRGRRTVHEVTSYAFLSS